MGQRSLRTLADGPIERDNAPRLVPIAMGLAGHVVGVELVDNVPHAKNILDKLHVYEAHADKEQWAEWCVKMYNKAREDGMTTEDAASKVNAAYLEYVNKQKGQ